MYEIELKAHVYNKQATIEKINSFASFLGNCHKNDTYWNHKDSNQQIRIRHISTETSSSNETNLVTYKQKQVKNNADGSSYEINQEHEFSIDNPKALEVFLADAGFSIFRKKEKITSQWKYQNSLLELCTVPPLGDFLEIEIIANDNNETTITEARKELLSILEKCGIEKKDIEPKYYNEMLREYFETN